MGLGNPGSRYARSRHNVGFRIVDEVALRCRVTLDQTRSLGLYGAGRLPVDPEALAGADSNADSNEEAEAEGEAVGFLQPTTFMNASGDALRVALSELSEIDPERDLLVVYDDLDLPLGRIRLRPSGGDGGHRGMTSVIDALGTRHFARLRFGVGRPEGTDETVTFVLEAFTAAEEAVLELGIPRASLAVITALREGVSVAMNRFNRDPDRHPDGDPDAAIL